MHNEHIRPAFVGEFRGLRASPSGPGIPRVDRPAPRACCGHRGTLRGSRARGRLQRIESAEERTGMSTLVMIEADGLCKQFGHFLAVRDVSFTIPKGQVVAFLGPNGAGKTTTMR